MSDVAIYDSNGSVLKTLYQWDVNQTLKITGLPVTGSPIFHFGNCKRRTAYVVAPNISGSNIYVSVPNVLLQEPETISMYVYYETAGDGEFYEDGARTEYAFGLPVKPRQRPDDEGYEETVSYIGYGSVQERLEMIASLEETYKATRNYNTGDLIVINAKLFEAVVDIPSGTSLIVNNNIYKTTLSDALASKGNIDVSYSVVDEQLIIVNTIYSSKVRTSGEILVINT